MAKISFDTLYKCMRKVVQWLFVVANNQWQPPLDALARVHEEKIVISCPFLVFVAIEVQTIDKF